MKYEILLALQSYYFRRIAEFFKAKPKECLMVGDSVSDAEAIRAGCKVVIIPSKFTKHCIV